MSELLVCFKGLKKALSWLEKDPTRFAILVDEQILDHPRAKTYLLESPLQIEPLAKKIAWEAVFKKIEILLGEKSVEAQNFQDILQKTHLAADLLLSEVADFHVQVLKNARANQGPFRRALGLKGAFHQVPAIIVGAGPSLKKNQHILPLFEDRALIFAGGSALHKLPVKPHFAASIDKEAPPLDAPSDIPFCYQSRMNPENYRRIQGEKLLFPDSSSLAINWIEGHEAPFDGGWTVGNFLTAFATLLGCSPIVFIGMDFCYTDGRKYAHQEAEMPELISVGEFQTQRDWAMAAQWTADFAQRHPLQSFINASEGGMGCGVKEERLETVLEQCQKTFSLQSLIQKAIQTLPVEEKRRWDEWDQNEEVVHQHLLLPLWQIWRPLFERELKEPQPELFFEQVLEEHRHASLLS